MPVFQTRNTANGSANFHYDGTLSQPAKGNMYKGPFHIPRMLLKCHLLCKEIQGYDKQ